MKGSLRDTPYSQFLPSGRNAAAVMGKGRPLHRRLVHAAQCFGVLSGLIGVIVFAGWMLGIAPLRDLTGVVTMKTNTALATLLAGAALVLLIPVEVGRGPTMGRAGMRSRRAGIRGADVQRALDGLEPGNRPTLGHRTSGGGGRDQS